MNKEDRQVDRNLEGIKLEKEGKTDKAISLYEKNLEENFEGSHPYNRLAIIYRKRGQIDEEIRVLEKAVYLYENVVYKDRVDRLVKLDKFKDRLIKALDIKSKK
jgi:tetratricopeptide (TPR) repeat protein